MSDSEGLIILFWALAILGIAAAAVIAAIADEIQ